MKLMIVIPCYNEEQVLPETAKRPYGEDADADRGRAVRRG